MDSGWQIPSSSDRRRRGRCGWGALASPAGPARVSPCHLQRPSAWGTCFRMFRCGEDVRFGVRFVVSIVAAVLMAACRGSFSDGCDGSLSSRTRCLENMGSWDDEEESCTRYEPRAEGRASSSCSDDSDCSGCARCSESRDTSGYATLQCVTVDAAFDCFDDLECPASSLCVPAALPSASRCTVACSTPNDCPPSFNCVNTSVGPSSPASRRRVVRRTSTVEARSVARPAIRPTTARTRGRCVGQVSVSSGVDVPLLRSADRARVHPRPMPLRGESRAIRGEMCRSSRRCRRPRLVAREISRDDPANPDDLWRQWELFGCDSRNA